MGPYRDCQDWKAECLARWREARRILRIRDIADRRQQLEHAGEQHGPEYRRLLEKEVTRQWNASRGRA